MQVVSYMICNSAQFIPTSGCWLEYLKPKESVPEYAFYLICLLHMFGSLSGSLSFFYFCCFIGFRISVLTLTFAFAVSQSAFPHPLPLSRFHLLSLSHALQPTPDAHAIHAKIRTRDGTRLVNAYHETGLAQDHAV